MVNGRHLVLALPVACALGAWWGPRLVSPFGACTVARWTVVVASTLQNCYDSTMVPCSPAFPHEWRQSGKFMGSALTGSNPVRSGVWGIHASEACDRSSIHRFPSPLDRAAESVVLGDGTLPSFATMVALARLRMYSYDPRRSITAAQRSQPRLV